MSAPDLTPSGASAVFSRHKAAIIVGVAVVAGLGAWFVTSSNREGGNAILGTASGEAKMVESGQMDEVAAEIGHSVFWAGERPGTKVEVRHDGSGNTHVRYLTGGAEPGDPSATYLDIGTYPFDGARRATARLANQQGLRRVAVGDVVGFFDPRRPTSVFLTFPDRPDYQVEVYHPDGDGALEVALSGDIVPMP